MNENSKKYDFAIINFWWADGHGAILTAFALQQFLLLNGYSSQLMKCARGYSDEKRVGGISQKFSDKYLSVTEEIYATYDDLFAPDNNKKLNSKYKAFITGSDQVFRAEWVPDSWFLSFVKTKGKIAVAASFGNNEFNCPDNERFERIKKSVSTFDFISVREDDAVALIDKCFEREATHILDPVFLIPVTVYENLMDTLNKQKQEKYIFCYILDENTENMKMVKRIAEKKGLKVVFGDSKMEVEEFLYMIKNSEFVITDSFHGMCFSIIFNKSYICILNSMRGLSRFNSLKGDLTLPEDAFVVEKTLGTIDNIQDIDYSMINEKLKKRKKQSIEYLQKNLKEVYERYK